MLEFGGLLTLLIIRGKDEKVNLLSNTNLLSMLVFCVFSVLITAVGFHQIKKEDDEIEELGVKI